MNKTVYNEVRKAYADCWMDTWEAGSKHRNLNFKASEFVPRNEAYDICSRAIPEGYNEFTANLIEELPNDVMIKIAREGSVALYVKTIDQKTLDMTLEETNHLRADEVHYQEDGTLRLWWD